MYDYIKRLVLHLKLRCTWASHTLSDKPTTEIREPLGPCRSGARLQGLPGPWEPVGGPGREGWEPSRLPSGLTGLRDRPWAHPQPLLLTPSVPAALHSGVHLWSGPAGTLALSWNLALPWIPPPPPPTPHLCPRSRPRTCPPALRAPGLLVLSWPFQSRGMTCSTPTGVCHKTVTMVFSPEKPLFKK